MKQLFHLPMGAALSTLQIHRKSHLASGIRWLWNVWENGGLVNYGFDATAGRSRIALRAEGAEVEFCKLALTPVMALTVKNVGCYSKNSRAY